MENTISRTKSLFQRVYAYATLGLLITAASSFIAAEFLKNQLSHSNLSFSMTTAAWVIIAVQLVLAFVIGHHMSSENIQKLSIWSIVFAVLEGFILAPVILATSPMIVAEALGATVMLFATLTLAAFFTNIDTSRWYNILWLSTLALLGVSLLNIFFFSNTLNMLTAWVSILIFSGWTMYDTQAIRNEVNVASNLNLVAVKGAVNIYLDFLNIFISILRIATNNN